MIKMMIRITVIIVALLAGLVLGPEISANKGYILLSFDGYTTYELTIVSAILIAIALSFLFLFFEWLLHLLLSMNSITRNWFRLRKTRTAQKNSLQGMLALFEGDNKQAQKLLVKSAPRSDSPALSYIAAAQAAHHQGKDKLRDEYFRKASDKKGCQLAAGLAWAELLLKGKEYQRASTLLAKLEKGFPKNQRISELYLSLYPATKQWKKYIDLLNNKRNIFSFDDDEHASRLFNAHQALFNELAKEEDALEIFWEKLARWMRKDINYQQAFLAAHIAAGNNKFAEDFLLEKIKKQFSPSLLVYFEKLQLNDYQPLILLLEKKLAKESEKGLIHQSLAHLQLKENKVEQAIKHLQESVKTVPSIKDFALLAKLLQKEERGEEANDYYRKGLLAAISMDSNT